jgi:putative colanic acid biosysnthesis UDP-glucose lipid carrier transferase
LKTSVAKTVDQLKRFDLVISYEVELSRVPLPVPLEQKVNVAIKRVFDLFTSLLSIACLLSWMLPLFAVLIRMDSKGPVFFCQKRHKKNGMLFTCIKFRTMIVNDSAHSVAAIDNDPRITTVGRFLRRHHLDELPQVLNVLMGDMSMVGPRPYMISDNEKYEQLIKDYAVRERIKPGITGLAQVVEYVNPITKTEYMAERVKKDLYYVYNWSPALDMKIVARTFFKMLGVK